jgi:hypothetical protein
MTDPDAHADEGESYDAGDTGPVEVDPEEAERLRLKAVSDAIRAGFVDG